MKDKADEIVTGQFSDSYLPIMDGVSLTISNYLLELNRALGPTYAVVPAFPGYSDPPTAGTYRFFSLPLIGWPPYRIGLPQIDFSLHRALKKQSFDLLHAHSPFSAGRLALRLARQRAVPIVATFHSKYRDRLENAIPWPSLVDWEVERIVEFYASADQVWVPSEVALETLREYGYRGAAEMVRHGIDLKAPRERAELRKRGEYFLRINRQDFLFLYVGDHALEKNLGFLIQALSLLKRSGCRFRMAFVGEGYAARAMRAMAKRLGIATETIFVGVLRDRAVLSSCYARADCFLFPSLYDTCGLVVKEAAAFEVPSVLIDGSAAAQQVVDGINGFITDNSVQAYAEKLGLLLDHPELIALAGEGARRTLYTTWRDAVQEVKERYVCLLHRAPKVMGGAVPTDKQKNEETYR
jgi:1,2-diacylglycerol 3-alpha-glucosyltransferase